MKMLSWRMKKNTLTTKSCASQKVGAGPARCWRGEGHTKGELGKGRSVLRSCCAICWKSFLREKLINHGANCTSEVASWHAALSHPRGDFTFVLLMLITVSPVKWSLWCLLKDGVSRAPQLSGCHPPCNSLGWGGTVEFLSPVLTCSVVTRSPPTLTILTHPTGQPNIAMPQPPPAWDPVKIQAAFKLPLKKTLLSVTMDTRLAREKKTIRLS